MKRDTLVKGVIARWKQKTSSLKGDFKWGLTQVKEAFDILQDVQSVWTARQEPPNDHGYEGYESLADSYGKVNEAVQDLSQITTDLQKVLRNLTGVRIATVKSIRLDSSVKRKIHLAFKGAGLDGNGNFKEPQDGFRRALELMEHFGIVLTDLISSHHFVGEGGRFTSEIGTPAHDTFDPPIPIKNSMFVMSFHRRGSGNFEVLAYLS